MSQVPPPTDVVSAEQSVEPKDSYSLLTAIGIGALAIYISKVLYESYKPHVPQILWSSSQAHGEKPTVYCVNFPKEQQALLTQALLPWFADDEIDVVFESMMIIDEEDEPTSSNIVNVTKGAARVAFNFLQEKYHNSDVFLLVYRSAVSLNNDTVDVFERKHEHFLTRAANKSFRETHCVGCTRDGKHVDILQKTVSGVVDAELASEEERRGAESAGKLFHRLANCVSPSKSSFVFKTKAFSSLTGSDSSSSVSKEELTKLSVGNQSYRPNRSSTLLWSSPFALFSSLGGALRYGRKEFGGTKLLLQIVNGPTGTLFGNTIDLFRGKDRSDILKLKDSFQGHFFVLFVTEGVHEIGDDVMSFIETYTMTACEAYTGAKAPSDVPLVQVVPHGGSTLMVVNLEGLKECCSVLQAFEIELAVGSLLSTFNLNVTGAKLGVARGAVATTILWPSAGCERGLFFTKNQYWVYPSTTDTADIAVAMWQKKMENRMDASTEKDIYVLSEMEL